MSHDGVLSLQGTTEPTLTHESISACGASESVHECSRRHIRTAADDDVPERRFDREEHARSVAILAFCRTAADVTGWRLVRRAGRKTGWTLVTLLTPIGKVSARIADCVAPTWVARLDEYDTLEGPRADSVRSTLRMNYLANLADVYFAEAAGGEDDATLPERLTDLTVSSVYLQQAELGWSAEDDHDPNKSLWDRMWDRAHWIQRGTVIFIDMFNSHYLIERGNASAVQRQRAMVDSWRTHMATLATCARRIVVIGMWELNHPSTPQTIGEANLIWETKCARRVDPHDFAATCQESHNEALAFAQNDTGGELYKYIRVPSRSVWIMLVGSILR
uniref:Uncharacterized protein n=1 Tax=viral metagenome TaxID=1070528 RepID=A0A2V0R9M2_9ZZZZ